MVNDTYFRHQGPWSDASVCLLSSDTGSWRTKRPVVDETACINCGLCALFCPVQCMEDRETHFQPDPGFCKGCGICSAECPKQAILMINEGDLE